MRNVYRKTARVRGRDYEKGGGGGGELRGRHEEEIGVHEVERRRGKQGGGANIL